VSHPATHPVDLTPSPPSTRWIVLSVVVAVAAALALLAAAWFAWDREAVLAWKESASPPLFFAAMAILPAFGVPLTPFYLIAGATFGVRNGLVGSLIALSLNLSICYLVARKIPRAWLHHAPNRFGQNFPNFEGEDKSGAVRFTMFVKLTPGVPMLLKNYLIGLSGVPFDVYLCTSLVTSAAYAVPLMLLGDSLFDHSFRKASIAVVLALVAVAGVWFWRRQTR
jgi:uncharacterized membrane protein YdjX (TVP38/TMEM64 family)